MIKEALSWSVAKVATAGFVATLAVGIWALVTAVVPGVAMAGLGWVPAALMIMPCIWAGDAVRYLLQPPRKEEEC